MNIPKKTEKEIISAVLAENTADVLKSAEELDTMLDKELSKPEWKIDFSLVNQLSMAVIATPGCGNYDIDVTEKLEKFKKEKDAKKSHFSIPRWTAGFIAACFVLAAGNIFTINAMGMDLFSFAVTYTGGGAIIDFKSDNIVLPVSADDPYGIIGKCREAGIDTETPHYIPDGFVLKEANTINDDNFKRVNFYFKNGKKSFSFSVHLSPDNNKIGIPSDKHNISETTVNGHSAVVSKEDNQMLVAFQTGDYYVVIFTENVDYNECDKILDNVW